MKYDLSVNEHGRLIITDGKEVFTSSLLLRAKNLLKTLITSIDDEVDSSYDGWEVSFSDPIFIRNGFRMKAWAAVNRQEGQRWAREILDFIRKGKILDGILSE